MATRALAGIVLAVGLGTATPAQAQKATFVRTATVEGREITIDNTKARIAIDVVDEFVDEPEQAQYARRLFRTYEEAYQAAQQQGFEFLPSVSLVAAKGKKFDDGMYAAVELAAERPFGSKLKLGKRELLQRVLQALIDRHGKLSGYPQGACAEAVRYVASALAVGGQLTGFSFPGPPLNPNVGRKPVGFYTWSPELANIFRRDTALQKRLNLDDEQETAAAAVLADVIHGEPELEQERQLLLDLYARLTNPLRSMEVSDMVAEIAAAGGLEKAIGDEAAATAFAEQLRSKHQLGLALLPPSESKEMFLLWEAGAMGISSMEAFIDAIRSGKIDLEPDWDSGWYEYQQYALEPLLKPDKMPEGRKLELSDKYKELLAEAFKSMMAQVRETHVKQLELTEAAAPPLLEVTVFPYLAVEPIASTYLRIGDGYEFLRGVLRNKLGPEALTQLHARDEGAVERPQPLGEELSNLQELMYGAYCLALRDVGAPLKELPSKWSEEHAGDAARRSMARAEQWLSAWAQDNDMRRDVRMMIPVARSPDVFWAVIGVKMTKLHVRFVDCPEVRLARGEGEVQPMFGDADYWVPTERFIEVQGEGEPLNREEFRALCDRAQTEDRIIKALSRRGLSAPQSATTGPGAQGLVAHARRGRVTWAYLVGAAILLFVLVGIAIVVVAKGILGRTRR